MRTFLGAFVIGLGMNIGLAFAAPGLGLDNWRWWAASASIIFLYGLGIHIQGFRRAAP